MKGAKYVEVFFVYSAFKLNITLFHIWSMTLFYLEKHFMINVTRNPILPQSSDCMFAIGEMDPVFFTGWEV